MKTGLRIFSFLLLAVTMTVAGCSKKPHVEWEYYKIGKTPDLMEEALEGDQPILAYFYAAWCGPCHYLKERTFSDLRVIEALQPFRRIKFDLSFKESPRIIAIHEKYQVRGLPHMIFIKPGEDPSRWTRIRGFVPAEEVLSVVDKFSKGD